MHPFAFFILLVYQDTNSTEKKNEDILEIYLEIRLWLDPTRN